MNNRLKININSLSNEFLEEIIQLGGVAYTKESAENELKRRKEEVLKIVNKYIGKCFIRVDNECISVYKLTDIIPNRGLAYDFIQFDNSESFISCIRNNDFVYIEDIEEFIEGYKEISEEEYNKYAEKYNKISEFVNRIIKE